MTFAAVALALAPVQGTIQVTPGKQIPGLKPIAYAAAPTGSRFVASLEDGSVRIIDAKNGQTLRILAKHPQPAYAVAWSKDGAFIATGDESGRVWVENALSGEKMREFRTHTRGVQRVSFNISHSLLITTGRDDAVHVLDLAGRGGAAKRMILGKGANFYGATFNPMSLNLFAVATLTVGGAREYDAATGNTAGLMTGHDAQGAMTVAFNPAGTRVASGGKDGRVSIYDGKTLKKLGTIKAHDMSWVLDLAFAPSGRMLASSSDDRTVKVWDTVAFKPVASLPNQFGPGSPLCFTADGTTLVTVTDQGWLQFNKITPPQPAK